MRKIHIAVVFFGLFLSVVPTVTLGDHYEDGIHIPDPVCVDPRGCGSYNPSPIDDHGGNYDQQEQAQLESPKNRLREILSRLSGIKHGLKTDDINSLLQSSTSVVNVVQLNQYVDNVYVSVTYQHRYLSWKFEQNNAHFVTYPQDILQLRIEKPQLESSLRIEETNQYIAESERDDAVKMAKMEERSTHKLWSKSSLASERLIEAQWAVSNAITALIPDNHEKATFKYNLGRLEERSKSVSVWQEYQNPVVMFKASPAVMMVGKSTNMLSWAFPEPTPTSEPIDAKLTTIDTLAREIISLDQKVSVQKLKLAPLVEKLVEAREENEALESRIDSCKLSIRRANFDAEEAKRRTAFEKENQNQYATDALTFAATAAVWNHVRTTIVMPQLERFLMANGLLKGMPLGDAIRRIGANPQELIQTTGRLKEWQTMINVQKKILELPEYFSASASAVADAMGNPHSDHYADFLAKDIHSGLSQREIGIMNKATESMPVWLRKIVQKWVKSAPLE